MLIVVVSLYQNIDLYLKSYCQNHLNLCVIQVSYIQYRSNICLVIF